MENKVLGLHHITAIAGNAQRNHDFYTKTLGLRMVKKTVNFDDPGTYHFYYGNELGTPGTILTFFPWEGIVPGRTGTGMATAISYSVPAGSLDFWKERFRQNQVPFEETAERFGEQFLPFRDPDGLDLELTVPTEADQRKPWETPEVKAAVASRGFLGVTLTVKNLAPTAAILTDILGYRLQRQEGTRYRFMTDTVENAARVDIIADAGLSRGHVAGGTNHHVAFRVKNEEILMQYREKIEALGLNITPKIDRDYFFSVYFREPGGILFELATDNPGFTRDEPVAELGTHLQLPKQFEPHRAEIEKVLPPIH